ncbi:hypothetical protein PR048_031169 [Dryococelus australis]|uniref:Uncharacterized protein n=1 Tax=Dryococelus australis TaxID=614101 RepID=A0ABQ9G4H2_9NEOP|nr:hypothetical protein PR048_031169 [Dryococelus australis]
MSRSGHEVIRLASPLVPKPLLGPPPPFFFRKASTIPVEFLLFPNAGLWKTNFSTLASTSRLPSRENRVRYPTCVAPGFLRVGILPDDATGRWVFSRISRFPGPFVPALLHTHLPCRSSPFKTSMLRAAQISRHHSAKVFLNTLCLGTCKIRVIIFGIRLNLTALYALEPASFPHWLLHKCEETPSLTELHTARRLTRATCHLTLVLFSPPGKQMSAPPTESARLAASLSANCNSRRLHQRSLEARLERLSSAGDMAKTPSTLPLPPYWESCRTMPSVGEFSREFPPAAPSFRRCSILTSINLIGSQDLVVKSCPNQHPSYLNTKLQDSGIIGRQLLCLFPRTFRANRKGSKTEQPISSTAVTQKLRSCACVALGRGSCVLTRGFLASERGADTVSNLRGTPRRRGCAIRYRVNRHLRWVLLGAGLLGYHECGLPELVPDPVNVFAPGFSDDAAGRRVFSGISRFPRACFPALLHTHPASPLSALKDLNVKSLPNVFTLHSLYTLNSNHLLISILLVTVHSGRGSLEVVLGAHNRCEGYTFCLSPAPRRVQSLVPSESLDVSFVSDIIGDETLVKITNTHVACQGLEPRRLQLVVESFRGKHVTLLIGYRALRKILYWLGFPAKECVIRRGSRWYYWPPTWANRARFPARPLLDPRMWESYRTVPLFGGFPRGSPASPRPPISALLHTHLALASSTLPSADWRLTFRVTPWWRMRLESTAQEAVSPLYYKYNFSVTAPSMQSVVHASSMGVTRSQHYHPAPLLKDETNDGSRVSRHSCDVVLRTSFAHTDAQPLQTAIARAVQKKVGSCCHLRRTPLRSGAAPYSYRVILIGSQDLDLKSRQISSLAQWNKLCVLSASACCETSPIGWTVSWRALIGQQRSDMLRVSDVILLKCAAGIRGESDCSLLRTSVATSSKLRNARGETRDPRENSPTSDIFRHDYQVQKISGDIVGGRTRFALVGGDQEGRWRPACATGQARQAPVEVVVGGGGGGSKAVKRKACTLPPPGQQPLEEGMACLECLIWRGRGGACLWRRRAGRTSSSGLLEEGHVRWTSPHLAQPPVFPRRRRSILLAYRRVAPHAYTANSSRVLQQPGTASQRHFGTSPANQRLVTYLPTGSSDTREHSSKTPRIDSINIADSAPRAVIGDPPRPPVLLERCARGCLLPFWESRECRQRRDLLASQTSSRLLGFPIRLATMQECSGETGWCLGPPRRITRVGEDSRWRPKTLYILPQPSGRQSLTEAAWPSVRERSKVWTTTGDCGTTASERVIYGARCSDASAGWRRELRPGRSPTPNPWRRENELRQRPRAFTNGRAVSSHTPLITD